LLTLPCWHIDAVKGGGVHPIAYVEVELAGVLDTSQHHRMSCHPLLCAGQVEHQQLAGCNPAARLEKLNEKQRKSQR
jgi:hypothetical protein